MSLLPHINGPEDFARQFDVSRETLERLKLYAELLVQWQRAVNLVAPATLPELWHRHMGDSAQIVDIVRGSDSPPPPGAWLDIGSGAGFPGLVAAILLADESSYEFHLIESNGRKCAFLSDVVRRTEITARVHAQRIEDVARTKVIGTVSVISARALASLDKLLTLTEPLMGEDTRAYYLKGREAIGEIEAARKSWEFALRQHESRTSSGSLILEIARQTRR
jgi:16S rRNA (guanine527-N7)-methyltransferase